LRHVSQVNGFGGVPQVHFDYAQRNGPPAGLLVGLGPSALRRPSFPHELTVPFAVPLGGVVYLITTKVLVVSVTGLDATELPEPLYGTTFRSSDPSVFTATPADPLVPDSIRLTPIATGMATLNIASSGDSSPGVKGITGSITVIVYKPAVEVLAYYTIVGTEIPVRMTGGSVVNIPIGSSALFTIEGRDADGNVVPLTNVAFSGGGTHFHETPTSNPQAWLIVSDSLGPGTLTVIVDPDPGPASLTITKFYIVAINPLPATHFAVTGDLQNP
jgi:hypothetical protein